MSIRFTYFLGFIASSFIVATSIYLQFFDGFLPCPLCTLQRFCFGLLAIFFLCGIILHAKSLGRWIINSLTAITAILGLILAGRQIWLQQFPAEGGECGVDLDYMLQVLPLNEVLQKIFAGSAECAQRGWEFLYLNMAEWAFLWFIGFLMLTGYLFFKEFKCK